ncbi:MAG: exonuclease SbcCD subunit D [Caldisericaceae bacterium]|nr:exonuclease SbcCD subunit D [Caldisericaceae bacterium]
MKIIHTADLHLGFNAYPKEGAEQRFASLNFLEDYALKSKPDIVLIAGDLFDRRDPPSFVQERFALFVKNLTKNGIGIFILTGNHEGPPNKERRIHLDVYSALEIPNVIVARKMGLYKMKGVNIVAVPYPYKKNLLAKDKYKIESEEEAAKLMNEVILKSVKKYLEKVSDKNPVILTMHIGVSEGKVGSEQYLALTNELTISVSDLDFEEVSYIAMGHLHEMQMLSTPRNNIPVVYPGSLERLNFGEENNKKGFFEVEFSEGTHTPSMEFVENPFARSFYTINLRKDEDTENVDWNKAKKSITRIKLLEDFENEEILKSLIEKLKKESYVFAGITDSRREKDETAFAVTHRAISPKQAIEKYLSEKAKNNEFIKKEKEKIAEVSTEILKEVFEGSEEV